MRQEINKLTDLEIKKATHNVAANKPQKYFDGYGLYLEVSPSGAKCWRMKYRFAGKENRLSFGQYPEISLKDARLATAKARDTLRNNIDPGEERKQAKLAVLRQAESSFENLANEWLAQNAHKWSEGHIKRIKLILKNNLLPWIGSRPIEQLTQQELHDVIKRTENKGTIDTARRANQIAGRVLTYASSTGLNARNFTQDIIPSLKAKKTQHFASITEPKEVGKLLVAIDAYEGTPAVKTALQLAPLFFCRPGELRQLEWSEVNFEEERIEIPASKMKSREHGHIIPLCHQAIPLLRELQYLTGRGKYVFPSARGKNRPLSDNALRVAIRTMGYDKETFTPHGFRAMARTILDEELNYRVDWIEHQLAHTVKDANGRAYNRTKYLAGRKEMLQRWADYLDNLKAIAKGGNIVMANFQKASNE